MSRHAFIISHPYKWGNIAYWGVTWESQILKTWCRILSDGEISNFKQVILDAGVQLYGLNCLIPSNFNRNWGVIPGFFRF